jgi:Xaa-Pro dipeptidase
MPEQHAARRAALTTVVAEQDVDAALITRLVNVRYLTGFTGSNGALLLAADGTATLSTDGRYDVQSAAQAPDVDRVIGPALLTPLVQRAAGRWPSARLAFEAHDMTVETHGRVAEIETTLTLVPLGREVERLRAVKDEEEIDAIRSACAVADRALARLLDRVVPGRSERDVAIELEALMRDEGGDGPSFETIVASGPNSAIPHHRPTARALERGDFVKFDFGSLFAGYHSDMTRTVVLGPPADWQREIYQLVATAQAAGCAALAVGATTGAVDLAARQVIIDAGHGDHYPHSLGHGVGLDIHEAPTLVKDGSDILRDRTPVTVEPGVYLPGRGGVRIEDDLVVRDAGPELLTTTTKELLVL